MKNKIDVTVVIATRDRVATLARLLQCVQRQDLQSFECVVVDDGSTDETLDAYGKIWSGLDERFRLLLQEPSERKALGPSSARNRGIKVARGEFIAFCDDDDLWLRDDHLSFAVDALRAHGADLFFGNMQMSRGGKIIGPDFYGTVRRYFARCRLPSAADLFEVSRRDRAAAMKFMFLHCNSLVVSGNLLHRAGLFWEKLLMAEDRDLGLRLLDRAERVLYRDVVVADYDRAIQGSICVAYTEEEVKQFVILAMLHAETSMQDAGLRRVAKGYRAWMLLELAQATQEAGRMDQTRELAWQSVMLRPTITAVGLLLRASFSSNDASQRQANRQSEAR